MTMKVLFLYLCVGRYCEFFDGWYESFVKYFATKAEKRDIIVWTDNVDDPRYKNRELVREVRYKEKKPWPSTLMTKHETFMEVADLMDEYDCVFYMNANTLFKGEVNVEDVLPDDDKVSRLVAVKHACLSLDLNSNLSLGTLR